MKNFHETLESNLEKRKKTVINKDRNLLQRLIAAYEAGREVNLHTILKHEFMPFPVAIAEMNGSLRAGSKSLLSDALIS